MTQAESGADDDIGALENETVFVPSGDDAVPEEQELMQMGTGPENDLRDPWFDKPEGAAWLVWLETTGLAVAMRQWMWLYPFVEIVHILGFVILVGSAFSFDVRLLGISRALPVTGMERHLLRWARASLLLIVPSGVAMFMNIRLRSATSACSFCSSSASMLGHRCFETMASCRSRLEKAVSMMR